MTTITGNGLEWYAWKVRASAVALEIKGRPLGMRSRVLKYAWPDLCVACGLPARTRMTIANLEKIHARLLAKADEAEALIKPGDITP